MILTQTSSLLDDTTDYKKNMLELHPETRNNGSTRFLYHHPFKIVLGHQEW